MFDIVRDPLWNNIGLDETALRLIDTRAFQRLRYVRQLGLAYLVYPGATHTRFEHALGTYHLAGRTHALLAQRGDLEGVAREESGLVCAAALLHDIGHYPFSHALEEIGAPHHEDVARALLLDPHILILDDSTSSVDLNTRGELAVKLLPLSFCITLQRQVYRHDQRVFSIKSRPYHLHALQAAHHQTRSGEQH